MNKQSLLIVTLITLSCCRSLAWSDELPWEVKTPFMEATIHYELTGMEQGKETLYIKDSGARQAKHHDSTSTIMGTTKKTQTIQITDPDWIYSYDLIEKKGGKATNPNKIYRTEYAKFNAEEKKNFAKNAKELGASGVLSQAGGSVKQKAGKVLGYDCDIASVGGISTVYLLHGTGIPLKAEASVMGMNNNVTATSMDTSTPIPDSAFAPPAGITVQLDQQMESMMTEMIKNTMDTLKQPDGAKQMQQAGPMGMMGGVGMRKMMDKEMQAEGISQEEQQEMMRQMNEAMQQMQKRQPKK